MPSVTTFRGYEILALCGTPSAEGIEFREFRADLGDGFRQNVNYGSSLGLKSWALGFKNMSGATNDIFIDREGVPMTKADYLWDLFCWAKRTGNPFIIESNRNGQYYLAEFADSKLTYERMLTKLFNTSLNFSEVRIEGVSVFDISKNNNIVGWYQGDTYLDMGAGTYGWTDLSGNDRDLLLDAPGAILAESDVQNGLGVMRFNSGASGGFSTPNTPFTADFTEVFMVLSVREATFSNFSGIFTNETTEAFILGDSGQSKFFDLSFGPSAYQYRKNGIEYAEAVQPAPMNTFGLVHARFLTPALLDNFQIGKDRAATDRYGKIDVGEVLILNKNPLNDSLEISQDLITRWGISGLL